MFADMEQKSQKFVPSSEKAEAVSNITVSPDRHVFAVAEKSSAGKPLINIYDLHSFRKRRTLSPSSDAQGLSKDFVYMAFSADAKYLAAQMGGPDWLLHYFSWEKGKVLACIKTLGPIKEIGHPTDPFHQQVPGFPVAIAANAALVSAKGTTIHQILICPTDACQVSSLGDKALMVFRYSEGVLRFAWMVQAKEGQQFLCHTWLPGEKVTIGTNDGKILIGGAGLTGPGEITQELTFGTSPTAAVNSIVNISRGFIASGNSNAVEVFDRYIDPDIKGDSFKMAWRLPLPDESGSVRTSAVSGSEGSLIIALETNQLLRIALTWSELLKGEEVKFESVFQSYHHGAITGMDACCRKPLLVTCSTDRSIRVWNYMTGSCELVKYFPEEAFSVALHPSGLYVLVGFSDKLRLLNILMDDFRLFKEFGLRGCRECRFSNGGHIFAAAHGNMIQLYSTWTFDNIANFKGHNGKVRSLYWTPDDSCLISSGSDGAVYTWVVREYKRENEHILKSCGYTSAVCTPDGKTVYAVGSDKMLKEINESTVTAQLETNVVLTQLAISHSGKMMFAGTSTGQIRSMKFPVSDGLDEYQEHQAHSSAVTKFRVSYDDQYLFSASEDGCLYMFKISDKDDRTMKRDRGPLYADEILITKSDLEEKTILMGELQRSLEELKLEHEYQLRLKDMNFNEKLKEITEKYSQEIEALKISTSVLRTEKDKEEVKHEEELQNFKAKHAVELHEVEAKYNQQLMEEYEKYQDLQSNTSALQEKWQKQMREFDVATQKSLTEAQAEAEMRLNAKSAEITKIQKELQQQTSEFKEMARQNDTDVDAEVQLVQSRYEKKLRTEKEEGARLKGENGIMRKKFNTLSKDIEDNKTEILRMKEDEKKLRGVIAMLEKEIMSYKKDMSERDELIQDKERRVYDLKKKNQELEKFKFVLDYRIKELKEQVEPRENEISDMSDQIQDINAELEILNKQKNTYEEEIRNLKNRLDATKAAYTRDHRKYQDIVHYMKVFRNDLHDGMQYVQEPHVLKKYVEGLFKKYCSGVKNLSNAGIDKEVKKEYMRQHDVLKEQIAELRVLADVNADIYRADNLHSMMENQILIQEINELREITRGKAIKAKNAEASSAVSVLEALNTKPKGPGDLHKKVSLPELRASLALPPAPVFRQLTMGIGK
ncbi:Cilia- and flagella-associated protein 57 [Chytridiales sp. JEL 0842]|nr:Cilia- and flagella-associated protein 57 [Chytridiales sp. JEL 0842]